MGTDRLRMDKLAGPYLIASEAIAYSEQSVKRLFFGVKIENDDIILPETAMKLLGAMELLRSSNVYKFYIVSQ